LPSSLRRPVCEGAGAAQPPEPPSLEVGAMGDVGASPSLHTKPCQHCGQDFQAKRSDAKTCSNRCRQAETRKRRRVREPSLFTKDHAVSNEVWRAREARRYTKRDPEYLLRTAWVEHKSFAAKIGNQSGGWIMPRNAPRGYGWRGVVAEIRPDQKVKTGDHWHWHGDPELLTDGPLRIPTTGKPLPRKWIHTTKEMHQHIEDVHEGKHLQSVHLEENWAKYVFTPGDGAKRLDVNPYVYERYGGDAFRDAEIVYFPLEGCIKNDSILSAGGVAFSIPSVTLCPWGELRRFSSELIGKPVILVCDADWSENWMVYRQAMLIRDFLRGRGVDAHVGGPPISDFKANKRLKGIDDSLASGRTLEDIEVIDRPAPTAPVTYRDSGRKRRIDLYAARILNLLATHSGIHVEPDGKTPDYTEDGTIQMSQETLGRILDIPPRTVGRTMKDLFECTDAFSEVRGSLETTGGEWCWNSGRPVRDQDRMQAEYDELPPEERREWYQERGVYRRAYDWQVRPTFVLAARHRPGQLTHTPLRAFLANRQVASGEQALREANQRRRLKEEYISEWREPYTTKAGRFKQRKYAADVDRDFKAKRTAEVIRLRREGFSCAEIAARVSVECNGEVVEPLTESGVRKKLKKYGLLTPIEERNMQQYEQAMANVEAALKRIEKKIDLESTLSTLRYGRMLREPGEEFGVEDVLLPIPEQREAA
jgi:predicted nucleic acid-binding Zn ribbon protein